MKKVAIFVEGPTEAYFVKRFLEEILHKKNITIQTFSGSGGSPSNPRVFTLLSCNHASNELYLANIYISNTDNRVNSDIIDNYTTLKGNGFSLIIGLKDLRGEHKNIPVTLSDLPKFESAEDMIFKKYPEIKSVIAVMEIETWFIGETNHYVNIDPSLTATLIQANTSVIGSDPYTCVLETITDPAETLDRIYHLVGKKYSKDKTHRERTINALDIANMYLSLPNRIMKLKDFVNAIDSFFS